MSFVKIYNRLHELNGGELSRKEDGPSHEVRYTGHYDRKSDTMYGSWEIELEIVEEGQKLISITSGLWKIVRA